MKHIKNWKAVNAAIGKYYEADTSEYSQKNRKYWMDRLAAADSAPFLSELLITVRWSRGIEGMVANANVRASLELDDGKSYVCGSGRAAGGGYDKGSAAVSEALSFDQKRSDGKSVKEAKKQALASVDRFVIEHGEALWGRYAIERRPFPHFCFGGKGMDTITGLFRRIGFKYSNGAVCKDYVIDFDESGRREDRYHIIHKNYI